MNRRQLVSVFLMRIKCRGVHSNQGLLNMHTVRDSCSHCTFKNNENKAIVTLASQWPAIAAGHCTLKCSPYRLLLRNHKRKRLTVDTLCDVFQ